MSKEIQQNNQEYGADQIQILEDKKYVYLPYEKVTPDNVNEFVKDEQ